MARYVLLIVNGLLGFPLWGDYVSDPQFIAIDTVIWSVVGLYVHFSSFLQLLYDERSVPLAETEDELWRFFFRHGGITRVLFARYVLRPGEIRTFSPGTLINDPTQSERLHLIIRGHVRAHIEYEQGHRTFDFYSGDLFEFRFLHQFGLRVGFLDAQMQAVAESEVQTFSIDVGASVAGRASSRGLERRARGLPFTADRRAQPQLLPPVRPPSLAGCPCLGPRPAGPARSQPTSTRQSLRLPIRRLCHGSAQPQPRSLPSHLSPPAAQAELATSPSRTSRERESGALASWVHPAFQPLDASELPPAHTPGSGRFFERPLRNFALLHVHTFSPPFPCTKPLFGLRHSSAAMSQDAEDIAHVARTLRDPTTAKDAAVRELSQRDSGSERGRGDGEERASERSLV